MAKNKSGIGSKKTNRPVKRVLIPKNMRDSVSAEAGRLTSPRAREELATALVKDIFSAKKQPKSNKRVYELPQHEPVTSHKPDVNHSTHYFDPEPPEDFYREPQRKQEIVKAEPSKLVPQRKREYFEPRLPTEPSRHVPYHAVFHDEPEEPEEHDEHAEFMERNNLPPSLHPDRFRKNPIHQHAILNAGRDPYQSIINGPELLRQHIAHRAIAHIDNDSNSFEERRNAHRLLQHIANHGNEETLMMLHDHPSPEVKSIVASRTDNPSILKKYIDSSPSIYDRPEHVKIANKRYNEMSWYKQRRGNRYTRKANKKFQKKLYGEHIELIKSLTAKKLLG